MADLSLEQMQAELAKREQQPWTLPRADQVHPELRSRFEGMAQDYYQQTGVPLRVTDSFRSHEEQADVYRRKPNLAAKPGHSRHEVETGAEALDIDQEQVPQLEKLGLLDKHGFVRPALGKGETWHVELPRFDKAEKVAATTGEQPSLEEMQAELARREGGGTSPALSEMQAELKKREQPAPAQQPEPEKPSMFGSMEGVKERALNPPNMGYRPEIVRPVFQGTGLSLGGAIGAAVGPFGAGAIPGAGLGYAIGNKAADFADYLAGVKKDIPPLSESLMQSGKDVATGAAMEATGQIGGKVLSKGLELGGNIARPVLGRMSGTGTGVVEEALKGSPAFTKAMRGEISGEEVVSTAQEALQTIKASRASDYQGKLAQIGQIQQEIDVSGINTTLRDMMKKWGVKVTPEGEIDVASTAIGNKGRKDIKDMIETVWTWKDKSPVGIDALKRYLSDFYSESSQARAFTTELTKKVTRTLEDQVPQYAEMTKPYAEATKIIKDIESGLMMRKQGMPGRVTADQTLNRLTSAMRDNFELRRDLVRVLGEGAGEDISGMVAGHAMSPVLPRGLMGIASASEAGLVLMRVISPKFLPILAASSPRVQGEFLRIFGKGMAETTGMSLPVAKMAAFLALRDQTSSSPTRQGQTQKPEKQSPSISFPSAETPDLGR